MELDPFKILGIAKDATKQEIKRAYRNLARLFHPDVCKDNDAKQKFIQIKKAYESLMNGNSEMKDNLGNLDRTRVIFEPNQDLIGYVRTWHEGIFKKTDPIAGGLKGKVKKMKRIVVEPPAHIIYFGNFGDRRIRWDVASTA